ncbi:MAG: hypothetical protein ABIJ08_05365 [Nanoarchaeota archaeon]
MKTNHLIPIIAFVGLAVLFFFPEPESNFPAYIGTAFFFIILITFLIIKQRKNSQMMYSILPNMDWKEFFRPTKEKNLLTILFTILPEMRIFIRYYQYPVMCQMELGTYCQSWQIMAAQNMLLFLLPILAGSYILSCLAVYLAYRLFKK